MMRDLAVALLSLLAGSAVAGEAQVRVEALASPVTVRLRGLSAFNDDIAWASGREGTVLRTVDGGKHWDVFKVPGAGELDFRDVQAFGADVALVMGAGPGDASRVYRTADGGRSWTMVLRNPDAEGFFDCMDFSGEEGRLLGDPVNGRFQVFASPDGGRSWRPTKGPKAETDEAAFAASGTCLHRIGGGTLVVTGGAHSRILYQPERPGLRPRWLALTVEGAPALASAGLFSVASMGGTNVAVGGDFKQERAPGLAFGVIAASDAVTTGGAAEDGRGVWFERQQYFSGVPTGYRSAIACKPRPDEMCIATGPSGSDLLADLEHRTPSAPAESIDVASVGDGARWYPVEGPGYDSVAIAGNVAWFSGDEGRLGRAELPSSK